MATKPRRMTSPPSPQTRRTLRPRLIVTPWRRTHGLTNNGVRHAQMVETQIGILRREIPGEGGDPRPNSFRHNAPEKEACARTASEGQTIKTARQVRIAGPSNAASIRGNALW